MTDHDEAETPSKPVKEVIFDSISDDRDWIKNKANEVNRVIELKERMLVLMNQHPVIEEWFKLYQEVTKRR